MGRERAKREQDRDADQAALDAAWQRLLTNDRDEVFRVLEQAFEDNEMPAAPVGVEGEAASLLVRIGNPADLIPEREVATTPTGKPTHKRRAKRDIHALYAEILASHVVATVKEAFAVAPGLESIRILAIRGDRLGGGLQLIPLYAGDFARAPVRRSEWKDSNALAFIEMHGDIRYRGQAQELAPLATKTDQHLRAAVDDIAAQLGWKPAP